MVGGRVLSRCGVHSRPVARLRAQGGATTSEYLVIAGVIVGIVLAIAGTFRTEIAAALDILGCQINAGAAGGGGGCGGGAGTSAAGGGGGAPGGTNPGGRLQPGQLVQVPQGGPGGRSQPGQVMPAGGPGAPGGGGGAGAPGSGGSPNPAALAGTGPNAPGGPTVTPGFPSTVGAALSDPWMTAGTAHELWQDSGYGTGTSLHTTTARYGWWVGQGWSGGSSTDKVGAMPPEDALDALGQLHDFGYAIAEEAGAQYGEAEKYRLMTLADEIGYRMWEKLPKDPSKWVPPPKDLKKAQVFLDRFAFVMRHMANEHESARQKAPKPTPAQLAALQARGPITATDLAAEEKRRVQNWNRDRGINMRANNNWR